MEKIIDDILKKIKENDTICIYGHIYPDGDCYGSQLGLKYAIQETFPNKKVYALGSGFKKMIPLLGEMDQVSDEEIKSSLSIVLDCSNFSRVEDKRYATSKDIIHIDHHVVVEKVCDCSYVDEGAISTTEILNDLLKKMNFKVSSRAATCLMLGLITDGGRFMYTPSENEFLVAASLIADGADLSKIYDVLYEVSENDIGFKGYYYSHYEKHNGVLSIIFDKEELEKLNKTSSEAAGQVNLLANVKGYPIWCAFAETEDGYKAEFRCKKGYEVASIAIKYNGGGHPCASGCSLKSKQEVRKVISELEDIVNHNNYESELKVMIEASRMIREKVLEIYNSDFDVEIKSDDSPVTLADKTADEIISKHLKEHFPDYALLTEESIDDKSRLENRYCFIVDPIDGTKDFVAKNGEFTTNIALCEDHEIVVGVVMIPLTGEIYYAVKNKGSYYQASQDSKPEKIYVSSRRDNLTLYVSRFHATDRELEMVRHFPQIKHVEAHGSSIKACLIAKGVGDIHYRLSAGTKEWDTAAIQIIVEEAGGLFIKPDGTRYLYNREDVYNREGYIITNCKENILIK